MRSRLWLLRVLAVAGIAVVAAPGSASIFDTDDRRTARPDDPAFRAIASVRTASGGHATGFLIGPCHLLTARHAIHARDPIGQSLKVQLDPSKRPSRKNSAIGLVVAAGGQANQPTDLSQDWALLELNRCLGRTFGYYRLNIEPFRPAPDNSSELAAMIGAGLPRDRKVRSGITVDPMCRVTSISAWGLLHDCATLPGNSGGPILRRNPRDGTLEAMAIIVAGYDDVTPTAYRSDIANVAVPIAAIARRIQPFIDKPVP